MKRTMLFAAVAALTFAIVSPAAADPMAQPTQVSVTRADLNLNQADDASALLRRFRGAARMTCGDTPAIRPLYEKAHIRSCVRTSMEHAVARANNPTVTEMYYGRRHSVMISASN